MLLLSTHADRQGEDISFTVCLFVCLVTDYFSAADKASGVTFCSADHRRPINGSESQMFVNFAPQKRKIERTNRSIEQGALRFRGLAF